MQVTNKMRSSWAKNREWGDYTKIAKELGVTPATVQRIVEGKEPYTDQASHRFVSAIQKFYKKRTKEVQGIMEDQN